MASRETFSRKDVVMARLYSLSSWFCTSLAIALAVLVPLTVPEDAFADDGVCSYCDGNSNCCNSCCQTLCLTGDPTCMSNCLANCAMPFDCTQCNCGLPGRQCDMDMCFNVPGCNTNCNCVPNGVSDCKCVAK